MMEDGGEREDTVRVGGTWEYSLSGDPVYILLVLFFLQVLSTSPVLPQSSSPTPNSLLTPISAAYPTILSDGSVGLWQQQWAKYSRKSSDTL